MVTDRTCTLEDCDSPHYGRGLCLKHYKADHYRRNRDKQLARAHERYDPEKRAANHQAYYARKAEERKAAAARYRAEHPEKARATVAAWVEANPDRKKQLDRDRWARDPERNAEQHRLWYEANKDKAVEAAARRRARKLGARVSAVDRRALLEQHGMICHLCGGPIGSRADLHFDHVIPLARGGAHSPENLRPAHAFCNLSKGARLPS